MIVLDVALSAAGGSRLGRDLLIPAGILVADLLFTLGFAAWLIVGLCALDVGLAVAGALLFSCFRFAPKGKE